ncbi:hypothetical protein CAPTEDRAFT_100199 [Capitella teleta]|uniref:Methionine adenosyltransferase 2 subunit beta n=1 Tax=Capitella teleta TaxID=283909 RepID=R7U7B3_CAPTE|nr:hypothetical protein CAPTEDRAFT_100199 [Capitella teleta]|eukprot:ELU01859.1 hypothetical protein CAPTEDRAFT_100199 [Capitella teleta]
MTQTRVLITGASGLLGRAVYAEFKRNPAWEALGLAFSRANEELRRVDLGSEEEIGRVIQEFKPQVIIHSAAEKRPNVVESQPEAAKRLNVDATAHVCNYAAKVGAFVIYISTDYVFEGIKPPHKPDDPTNPLNAYGKWKLEGEKAAMLQHEGNLILRVPILYGDIESFGESAITYMFPMVKDSTKEFLVSDYEKRYPTHCADVAVVLRQMAEKKLQNDSFDGIFHWSGAEEMTKYDMCLVMADVFNLPKDHIKPDRTPTTGAVRPYNAHLDSSRLEDLGIGQRRTFKEGAYQVFKPFL